ALEFLREVCIADWTPIREALEAYLYPGRCNAPITQAYARSLRAFGLRMLQDVIALGRDRPSLMRWARRIVRLQKARISVPVHEEFEILFPSDDVRDWRKTEMKQVAAARKLAKRWGHGDPQDVAARLTELEREAQGAGTLGPRYGSFVCAE